VFCRAAGRADWLDKPEWQTAAGRTADRAALNAAIARRRAGAPARNGFPCWKQAGIPCGPINSIAEVFADPQVAHLGMVWQVPHERLGQAEGGAYAAHAGGLVARHQPPGAGPGRECAEVLAEAGLTPARSKDCAPAAPWGDGLMNDMQLAAARSWPAAPPESAR
jgi:formyl-CoA transferase